ncbi:hypothetical protein [Pseudonocardia acaciae]|uniref:hypothetical protein n=1 Tax=Pseudonocardia acaciae TaxID=551276 RepID=UPI0012ED3688|nr:hypothetical protein [Pseudonocardia acaciae]
MTLGIGCALADDGAVAGGVQHPPGGMFADVRLGRQSTPTGALRDQYRRPSPGAAVDQGVAVDLGCGPVRASGQVSVSLKYR